MLEKHPQIVIVGGTNLDIKWRAHEKIYPGSSGSAEKTEHHGGVARNIAEALARLGLYCRFISWVGNDQAGHRMIESLSALKVNIDGVVFSHKWPTATYCAFFHAHGDLHTALIDTRIYEECSIDSFKPLFFELIALDIVVLDTDLPPTFLHYLLSNLSSQRWVSLTSIPTVHKIASILDKIDALFLNRSELNELCSQGVTMSSKISWLHKKGVKMVVVTEGEQGASLSYNGAIIKKVAIPTTIVDVTGAGDSLLAGCLFGHLQGWALPDILSLGIKAASLSLQGKEAVASDLATIIHNF